MARHFSSAEMVKNSIVSEIEESLSSQRQNVMQVCMSVQNSHVNLIIILHRSTYSFENYTQLIFTLLSLF